MKMKSLIEKTVLTGIAVVTLAMATLNAAAQERYWNFDFATNVPPLFTNAVVNIYTTNTYTGAITTNTYPANAGGLWTASNVGTNGNYSVTNQSTYVVGGPAVFIGAAEGFVLSWQVTAYAVTNSASTIGTNGSITVTADLSQDGIYWSSNAISQQMIWIGAVASGTQPPITNTAWGIFPNSSTTGTNVLTNWKYARIGEVIGNNTNALMMLIADRWNWFR